jgi:hypothetical protein
MTLLRMGRATEAEVDMQAGAYLEARAPGGAYAVDRSIQRLQGRDRLALEKVRRRVRFEVEQKRRAETAQRFEQTQRREAEVLRVERRPTYDEAVQLAGGDNSAGQTETPATTSDAAIAAGGPTAPGQDLPPPVDTTTADAPPTTDVAENANDDPFATGSDDPFAPGTTVASSAPAAVPPAETVEAVEVGEKVGGTKLLGIIGGIFSGVAENNLPDQLPMVGGIPSIGGGSAPPVSIPSDEADPFGGDPFGGDAAPVAEPPGSTQAPPPVIPPPATTDDDPFGGADPFGGNEPMPPANDPFGAGDTAPADDNNPFGAGNSDASAEEADPFGGADDPFN